MCTQHVRLLCSFCSLRVPEAEISQDFLSIPFFFSSAYFLSYIISMHHRESPIFDIVPKYSISNLKPGGFRRSEEISDGIDL